MSIYFWVVGLLAIFGLFVIFLLKWIRRQRLIKQALFLFKQLLEWQPTSDVLRREYLNSYNLLVRLLTTDGELLKKYILNFALVNQAKEQCERRFVEACAESISGGGPRMEEALSLIKDLWVRESPGNSSHADKLYSRSEWDSWRQEGLKNRAIKTARMIVCLPEEKGFLLDVNKPCLSVEGLNVLLRALRDTTDEFDKLKESVAGNSGKGSLPNPE